MTGDVLGEGGAWRSIALLTVHICSAAVDMTDRAEEICCIYPILGTYKESEQLCSAYSREYVKWTQCTNELNRVQDK